MTSLRPEQIKEEAGTRLAQAPQLGKILLIFNGILLALCLIITGGSYLLDDMMANSGGLGAIGKRTMIQTIQRVLPFINLIAMMILELGMWNAMLRIGRGQYTSPQSLKMGISRFFPWLRFQLLEVIGLIAIGSVLMFVAMAIFFMTPLAKPAMELMLPLATQYPDSAALAEAMMADEAMLMSVYDSLMPMYIILAVLMLIAWLPISYRLRVANLIILDDPTAGAFKALIRSFRQTKICWKWYVRLDLSFWWYYVLLVLTAGLNYLDKLLAAIGSPLPMGATAASLLSYGLYLVAQLALYYYLRPKVQVSTAILYDALLPPKKEPTNGVVLGNIFRM